jgi:pantetheine-phosphate adenylyltransferase
MKTALYPGTFDPVTRGHESVLLRASDLFDKVIVAIGYNSKKQCMFSLEERLAMFQKMLDKYYEDGFEPNIEVTSYEGLTANFCKDNHIRYIVRGVRSNTDFNEELSIANVNQCLYSNIETVLLLPDAEIEYPAVSSSIVREILINNGDVSKFVPNAILDMLKGGK